MHLAPIDWAIIVASLAIGFIPALLMARRAGSSTAEFFTSGQAAPWWLIGVSMVATTFSTDTPNLVTNLDDPDCAKVQQDGTYVDGIRYALQKFADMPNVYTYLDIAHSGWLGWSSNFDPAVQLYTNVVRSAAGGDMSVVDGFVSNVANYTPTEETWLPDPEQRTVELQKLYDVRPFDLVLLDLVVPEDQRISVAS